MGPLEVILDQLEASEPISAFEVIGILNGRNGRAFFEDNGGHTLLEYLYALDRELHTDAAYSEAG